MEAMTDDGWYKASERQLVFKLEIYIKVVSSLLIGNYIDVDPLNVSSRSTIAFEPYFHPLKEAVIMMPSRRGPLCHLGLRGEPRKTKLSMALS